MTSRTPKFEGPPGDFSFSPRERELLRAAKHDRMPLAQSQSLRAALDRQLTAAPVSTTVPTKGLRATYGLRMKIAIWGTFGALLLGSLAQVVWRRADVPRAQLEHSQPKAAQPLTLASTPAAHLDPPEAQAAQPEPVSQDALRLELELLEGARAALGRGAPKQAAQFLERYDVRFAQGTLRPESEALRIELDMRRGQPGTARRQAERFLSVYPEHPLRERVRQLTQPAR